MKKKILHYAILASVLLGVPALCAWLGGRDGIWEGVKSFPPRTEDWGLRPEKLWNVRRPFSWPCFAGLVLFTFACMRPLAARWFRALGSGAGRERRGGRFPWWGWAGLAELAVAWVFAWGKFDFCSPVQPHISYMPLWIGYILVMNALCAKRSGTCPMLRRPFAYLATFPASSLFWWFFEYLNRYVWNWYYLGIERMGALEYTFYASVCFSSVLPAVTATAAFLKTFGPFAESHYAGMWKVDVRSPRAVAFFSFFSLLGLSGIVFFPQWAFPLLWLSPLMVFVLVQTLLGERSILDRLKDGNWGFVFRFAMAALICGFAWETWNYYAAAKWVYSIPFVHRFQIWEMPVIGFGGYLPFGMECAAVTAWICPGLVDDD